MDKELNNKTELERIKWLMTNTDRGLEKVEDASRQIGMLMMRVLNILFDLLLKLRLLFPLSALVVAQLFEIIRLKFVLTKKKKKKQGSNTTWWSWSRLDSRMNRQREKHKKAAIYTQKKSSQFFFFFIFWNRCVKKKNTHENDKSRMKVWWWCRETAII